MTSKVLVQHGADVLGMLLQNGILKEACTTRAGHCDGNVVGDAPGTASHHDHPIGQRHGLTDIMGNEDNGRPLLDPQSFKVALQLFPGQRIERTERLVHQKQGGLMDKRSTE